MQGEAARQWMPRRELRRNWSRPPADPGAPQSPAQARPDPARCACSPPAAGARRPADRIPVRLDAASASRRRAGAGRASPHVATAARCSACCAIRRCSSAMPTARAASRSRATCRAARDHLPQSRPRNGGETRSRDRSPGWLLPPASQHARRFARQHPPPLRSRQRVLLAVARRDHGLHLRLLPERRGRPRGGPGRQDGSRLPQAAARRRRHVVEAGCGWGSLALHMASRYGARVRAFNISREQIAFARKRASEQGLEGRVEFIEDDYRNISGRYDVFVSVGMLEHVGRENYPELGRVARRSLAPEGRGLIHSIGRNRPAPLQPWIERRIFPGAYPPSLGEMMQIFEPVGPLGARRREHPPALRAHAAPLAGALRGGGRQGAQRCSMSPSCACGGCIWQDRSPLSRAGRCSCSRCCSRPRRTTDIPLTREYMYPR